MTCLFYGVVPRDLIGFYDVFILWWSPYRGLTSEPGTVTQLISMTCLFYGRVPRDLVVSMTSLFYGGVPRDLVVSWLLYFMVESLGTWWFLWLSYSMVKSLETWWFLWLFYSMAESLTSESGTVTMVVSMTCLFYGGVPRDPLFSMTCLFCGGPDLWEWDGHPAVGFYDLFTQWQSP
jgi:hypothetical protein